MMRARLRRWYGQMLLTGAQLGLAALAFSFERPISRGILATMAAISFFAWRSSLKRYRAVADLPVSPIGAAAQGYVKIAGAGRMVPDWHLPSRINGLDCLWHRWVSEERNSEQKWEVVDSGESVQSFLIDDGTGVCQVMYPELAEIIVKEKQVRSLAGFRETEWRLAPGETIYALGEFRTRNIATELDAAQDTVDRLDAWKRDRPTLLKRFDLNGDGEISLEEWELARAAARREVLKEHAERRLSADYHTLLAPASGQVHIISDMTAERVQRRYLYWSLFHLAVFFGALAGIAWLSGMK